MHAIKEKPVVVDGEIVIRPIMVVALTYDHRLLDGREAVTFLGKPSFEKYVRDATINFYSSQSSRLHPGPVEDVTGLRNSGLVVVELFALCLTLLNLYLAFLLCLHLHLKAFPKCHHYETESQWIGYTCLYERYLIETRVTFLSIYGPYLHWIIERSLT
jgi:hypothetical protein